MRRRHRLWAFGLLVSVLLAAIPVAPAAAATPTRFGAKFSFETEPTPPERCDDHGSIPASSNCSWVVVTAFENAGHERAPKSGTINRVRLISCVAGSFTMQAARYRSSDRKAKIVRSGPKITYGISSHCDDHEGLGVQSFRVSFHVNKGDWISVKAKRVGFIHNSSSGPTNLYAPPPPVGGSYASRDSSTGGLLIQYQYAS